MKLNGIDLQESPRLEEEIARNRKKEGLHYMRSLTIGGIEGCCKSLFAHSEHFTKKDDATLDSIYALIVQLQKKIVFGDE